MSRYSRSHRPSSIKVPHTIPRKDPLILSLSASQGGPRMFSEKTQEDGSEETGRHPQVIRCPGPGHEPGAEARRWESRHAQPEVFLAAIVSSGSLAYFCWGPGRHMQLQRGPSMLFHFEPTRHTAYVHPGIIGQQMQKAFISWENILIGLPHSGEISVADFWSVGEFPFFYFIGFASGFTSVWFPYSRTVLADGTSDLVGLGSIIRGGRFVAVTFVASSCNLLALKKRGFILKCWAGAV